MGSKATTKEVSNDAFNGTSNTKNSVMPAPTPPTSHQKRPPSNPHVRPLESDAALVSVRRRSVFMAARGGWRRDVWRESEIADADAAVRVNAEDFVEGEHGSRRSRDDRPANNAHFALVNIAAPDREAAVDDSRDTKDETEHHDYGEAVADAGFELGGVERLREGRHGVE